MSAQPAGRVGAIILARMDSRRLPGKALADVHGRPLLWYLHARLARVRFSGPVVLATSNRSVDDPLAGYAAEIGLSVYRGSADDVTGRLLAAAGLYGLDGVLRVNGDSPFVDAGLIEQALAIFAGGGIELVSNIRPRTYPYGVSIELFPTAALARVTSDDPYDREHVTPGLYRAIHPPALHAMRAPGQPVEGDLTRVRLTIDEPADLQAFRRFTAERLDRWLSLSYWDAIASGLFRTF